MLMALPTWARVPEDVYICAGTIHKNGGCLVNEHGASSLPLLDSTLLPLLPPDNRGGDGQPAVASSWAK